MDILKNSKNLNIVVKYSTWVNVLSYFPPLSISSFLTLLPTCQRFSIPTFCTFRILNPSRIWSNSTPLNQFPWHLKYSRYEILNHCTTPQLQMQLIYTMLLQWRRGNNACIFQTAPQTEGKHEPDLVREKHILDSPFHSEYSDQYCGRMLNICHRTITHWWNKSMDDRREWEEGGVLAYLAPEGWGGKRGRKDGGRWRFVALWGWDFSPGDYLFSFFCVDGGQPWAKGWGDLGGGCMKRSLCENAVNLNSLYFISKLCCLFVHHYFFFTHIHEHDT